MNRNWNLPPGCTLRDIDPLRICARCEHEADELNDCGICRECESDMLESRYEDDGEQ